MSHEVVLFTSDEMEKKKLALEILGRPALRVKLFAEFADVLGGYPTLSSKKYPAVNELKTWVEESCTVGKFETEESVREAFSADLASWSAKAAECRSERKKREQQRARDVERNCRSLEESRLVRSVQAKKTDRPATSARSASRAATTAAATPGPAETTARPMLTMSSEIAAREATSTTLAPIPPAHVVGDDAAARFCEYFAPSRKADRPTAAPTLLTSSAQRADLESALFAYKRVDSAALYLNVSAPFCLVAVGMQGAGKSHTVASVLEACVLPLPPSMASIVKLKTPMAALVFHYDQNETNMCEATGLLYRAPALEAMLPPNVGHLAKIVVLVSPTFYLQRKKWYEDDRYEVLPMLFEWRSLQATQLKKLMRLEDNAKQLYVATMLSILKRYQRENQMPSFRQFEKDVMEACAVEGQAKPLTQRFDVLRDFIAESEANVKLCAEHGAVAFKLRDYVESGRVIVADFTDPMMTPQDANGVFHVLLEIFRQTKCASGCGKIVVCDEAHKYIGDGGGGLAREIVDAARMMRHDSLRIVVSTQSPLTLPTELLELTSVAVLHKFQSPCWYKCIASCVALPKLTVLEDGVGNGRDWECAESCFEQITKLHPGEAMVCTRDGTRALVRIRNRITKDRGQTRVNSRGGGGGGGGGSGSAARKDDDDSGEDAR